MASTARNSKSFMKVGKKIIMMDEDDNQANWREILFREVWKNAYIPKDLRDIIKIEFNKNGEPIIYKK